MFCVTIALKKNSSKHGNYSKIKKYYTYKLKTFKLTNGQYIFF